MIFIDPDLVEDEIPNGWREAANALTAQLISADSDDRSSIVNSRSEVWRSLKERLARVGSGKCWYCETKDSRADNAVDHFRPKGRVASEKTHPGYWWLAFDWTNLRFSCTYCNSRRRDIEHGTAGGKQDQFPLAEGSERARSHEDRLDKEVPLLLDPCWLGDVDLLWFDDSGQVRANPSRVLDDSLEALRVKVSKEIYHLDHVRLIRERKRVYRTVHRLLKRVDFAWTEWRRVQDEATQRNYEDLLLQLRQFVVRESQYSAAARCALLGYKSDSGAITAVLRFL